MNNELIINGITTKEGAIARVVVCLSCLSIH